MRRSLLLGVVLALCLLGCSGDDGKDGVTTLVPAVSQAVTLTCRDFCGRKPDEQVSIDRIARSNKYCLVGDECFFDCPPKDC